MNTSSSNRSRAGTVSRLARATGLLALCALSIAGCGEKPQDAAPAADMPDTQGTPDTQGAQKTPDSPGTSETPDAPTAAASDALARASSAPAGDWIRLFNGRNLDGWTVKFTGHEPGENLNDTFRVEDGLLEVRYDGWDGFDGQFGHLFHEGRFSHYVIAAEYRFIGEQVEGGPDWARRNNGLMLHSQSVESMGRDQGFPISLEVQLLGGLGEGPRSTANLCTPGTHVVIDRALVTEHCIDSSSQTYDGDQWVRVEALVLGDRVIAHRVNGDTVLTYTQPRMGGGGADGATPGTLVEGRPLAEGYIALQAETAPVDFRKVELLNLVGCTDPKASNYRDYVVEDDPGSCRYPAGERASDGGPSGSRSGGP